MKVRINQDTHVWGVDKIVLERITGVANTTRTKLRFIGADGEESTVNLCVWGEHSDHYDGVSVPPVYLEIDGVQTLLVAGARINPPTATEPEKEPDKPDQPVTPRDEGFAAIERAIFDGDEDRDV